MIKYSVLSGAFLFCFSALNGHVARADDSPDAKVEMELSQKYNAKALAPVDEGDFLMLTKQLPHKSYTTKKKETLMEISEVIFGDSHYWTKLWSLNKGITNPYEVAPGTTLTLSEPTAEEPPVVGITFNKPESTGPAVGPEILSYSLNAEIPLPSHDTAPAMQDFPRVLPNWKFLKGHPTVPASQLDLSRPIVHVPVPIKNLDFYVGDDYSSSVGEIVATELHLKAAGEYQYVYVRLDETAKEKSYTVIKDQGVVETDFSTGDPVMTQVLGSIDILDVVDKSEGIYRALVKKALSNVEVGAKLIPGSIPTYAFQSGPLAKGKATIIGGHFATQRRLFGAEAVVFLDHGQQEGISVGQILPIYQFQRAKLDSGLIKSNPLVIGKLKVVKTSKNFATAVILDSSREVEVGDGTSPDLENN